MSTSTLILKFGTMSGEKKWSFSGADPEVPVATVKTLMNTMITNGSIYKYPPLTIVGATLRTVNEADYDLSD